MPPSRLSSLGNRVRRNFQQVVRALPAHVSSFRARHARSRVRQYQPSRLNLYGRRVANQHRRVMDQLIIYHARRPNRAQWSRANYPHTVQARWLPNARVYNPMYNNVRRSTCGKRCS